MLPSCIEFKEPLVQVTCGGFHTAVLTDAGRVYTWGDGRSGQLGNLARKHNMLSTPHLVDYFVNYRVVVKQLACGQYHTACIGANGALYTWGNGRHGQLGHGARLDERYPRQVEVDKDIGKFHQVACGDRHTATITEKRAVVTFGSGQHGQLGHGNGLDMLKPKKVEALQEVKLMTITAGATMTAAINDAGVAYLWGFGESLHPKEQTNIVDSPRVVKLKEPVKQIVCGQSHVLVLTEEGDVYTFGSANMGQLGHGARSNVRNPRLILKGKDIHEIAAGRYHSMCVNGHGVLYTWGCGESGQLAHNSLESEYLPRIVDALLPNVVGQIACGEHHSVCLASIEHSAVSAEVMQWKRVEEEELAMKRELIKSLPNGLKSAHILQIQSKRSQIEERLQAELAKIKELQAEQLREQLMAIRTRDELTREVQDLHERRLAVRDINLLEAGTGNVSQQTTNRQSQSPTHRSSAIRKGSKRILNPISPGDSHSPKEDQEQRDARRSLRASASQSSGIGGIAVAHQSMSATLPAPGREMNRSASALIDRRESRPGSALRGSSSTGELLDALSRPRTSPFKTLRNKSPQGKGAAAEQEGGYGYGGESKEYEPDSKSPAREYGALKALTTRSGASEDSNRALVPRPTGDVAFHPLAPRLTFIEKTTSALNRVKRQLAMGKTGGPPTTQIERDLIERKNEYNQLRAVAKEKYEQLMSLKNRFYFEKPTDEDANITKSFHERTKDLKMKLVTLNTRLMEAAENKANYELYIIRMKEEDLQLSKQIDSVRQLVAEYDRLVQKMAKINWRIAAQKGDIDAEIIRFQTDIGDFADFAQQQLNKYRTLLQLTVQDAKFQDSLINEKLSRQESKHRAATESRELIARQHEEEALEIKDELSSWQNKVNYYEKRFHKITAVTGLSHPDDIINKFFSNDQITANLDSEIAARKEQVERLHREKKGLLQESDLVKNGFVTNKWRDVDRLDDEYRSKTIRAGMEKKEVDKLMERLAVVHEFIQTILSGLDLTLGQEDDAHAQGQGHDGRGDSPRDRDLVDGGLSVSEGLSLGLDDREHGYGPGQEDGKEVKLEMDVSRSASKLEKRLVQLIDSLERTKIENAVMLRAEEEQARKQEEERRQEHLASKIIQALSNRRGDEAEM